jgi:ABC-type Na+ efflux pump permease subunit
MSKLRSVVRHEYLTVVKQKGFWAYMIIMPLVFLLVFVLIGLVGRSDNPSLEKTANDLREVAVIDASGLVSPDVIAASGQKLYPESDYEALRADVESGERKGLIYYPSDLLTSARFTSYVSGVDFIFSTSINQVGGSLLQDSLYAPLGSAEKISLAQRGAEGVTTTFANGTTSIGYTRFVVPGVIAAMFFLVLLFSIGYILTSISDEKKTARWRWR